MTVLFVALALALFLIPFALLFVFERMARAGKEPLTEPDRVTVLDGVVVPIGGYVPLIHPGPPLTDSLGAERCATESRIVADRMAGALDPVQYQQKMAALAALDATTRPLRLPPEPR
jgi:hypothetical protein